MHTTKPNKHRMAPARVALATARIGVRLRYEFDAAVQHGASLDNPLIELLEAVIRAGSIRHAAKQLGRSYRHIWGTLRRWEQTLGEPLIAWSQGRRARPTAFAERLLRAEQRARTRVSRHIEALRGDLAQVIADARNDGSHHLRVHASHDLALPVMRQFVAEHEDLDLDLEFAGSVDALRALRERRCRLAGFHVPIATGAIPVFASAFGPLLDPVRHKVIPISVRTQGLMMRKEHSARIGALRDIAACKARFVNRQPGSGTRMLMDHLLHAESPAALDAPWVSTHIENTHTAAALCVASGVADVGIGIKAAALQYGLHFLPLVHENYFLACHAEDVEEPAMQRLRLALGGTAWHGVLSAMPGYAPPAEPGAVVALDTVMPFWSSGRRTKIGRKRESTHK